MKDLDTVGDLRLLVAAQTARIERLEALLSGGVAEEGPHLENERVSRRRLLRLGGAAAAGTAASLLAGRAAAAAPSADGDVKLGGTFTDNNAGTAMTRVQAAIAADPAGTGRAALYGYNTGTGQGVLGQSGGIEGIGVWGLGAGTDGIGVRAQGAFPLELVSADGAHRTRFTLNGNGPPLVQLDNGSNARLAVVGATNNTTAPTMMFGAMHVGLTTRETNVAVSGDASSPEGPTIGVLGRGRSGTVSGVVLPGYGVQGQSDDGIGVFAEGGRAQLRLLPGDTLEVPAGPHSAGEVYVSATSDIRICKVSGSPGTWTRIGYNALNPPYRLIDTRDSNAPLGPRERRAITIAPSGTATNGVPGPGASSAVMVNVTAVPAPGHSSSYLTVMPHNSAAIPANGGAPYSNVNWVAGQLQANLATVAMPDFATQIDVYNHNGNVHLIIDVLGFFS